MSTNNNVEHLKDDVLAGVPIVETFYIVEVTRPEGAVFLERWVPPNTIEVAQGGEGYSDVCGRITIDILRAKRWRIAKREEKRLLDKKSATGAHAAASWFKGARVRRMTVSVEDA